VNKRACYWCDRREERSQLDKVPICTDCAKCFDIPQQTINEPSIEPTDTPTNEAATEDMDVNKFDYKHWFNQYGNTED
jgi:hypothetical protein